MTENEETREKDRIQESTEPNTDNVGVEISKDASELDSIKEAELLSEIEIDEFSQYVNDEGGIGSIIQTTNGEELKKAESEDLKKDNETEASCQKESTSVEESRTLESSEVDVKPPPPPPPLPSTSTNPPPPPPPLLSRNETSVISETTNEDEAIDDQIQEKEEQKKEEEIIQKIVLTTETESESGQPSTEPSQEDTSSPSVKIEEELEVQEIGDVQDPPEPPPLPPPKPPALPNDRVESTTSQSSSNTSENSSKDSDEEIEEDTEEDNDDVDDETDSLEDENIKVTGPEMNEDENFSSSSEQDIEEKQKEISFNFSEDDEEDDEDDNTEEEEEEKEELRRRRREEEEFDVVQVDELKPYERLIQNSILRNPIEKLEQKRRKNESESQKKREAMMMMMSEKCLSSEEERKAFKKYQKKLKKRKEKRKRKSEHDSSSSIALHQKEEEEEEEADFNNEEVEEDEEDENQIKNAMSKSVDVEVFSGKKGFYDYLLPTRSKRTQMIHFAPMHALVEIRKEIFQSKKEIDDQKVQLIPPQQQQDQDQQKVQDDDNNNNNNNDDNTETNNTKQDQNNVIPHPVDPVLQEKKEYLQDLLILDRSYMVWWNSLVGFLNRNDPDYLPLKKLKRRRRRELDQKHFQMCSALCLFFVGIFFPPVMIFNMIFFTFSRSNQVKAMAFVSCCYLVCLFAVLLGFSVYVTLSVLAYLYVWM